MTLYEVDEAASRVRQEVDPEANIIVGATFDEQLGDRLRVSIVASGMNRAERAIERAEGAAIGRAATSAAAGGYACERAKSKFLCRTAFTSDSRRCDSRAGAAASG